MKYCKKIIALLLSVIIIVGNGQIVIADVDNPDLSIEEQLFGLSMYRFHYLDENGNLVERTQYCTSAEDIINSGIFINKNTMFGNAVVDIEIDAARNEEYNKCKPVLIWVHQGDALLDDTKWTDIDKWYDNKLSNGTLLLTAIDSSTTEYNASVSIKSFRKDIITSLLAGGYWEVEFYSEDAIPDKLRFAYETHTMTEDELEKYIQENNIRVQQEWYNTDTGFRTEKDGFPFGNIGAQCAGYSALAIMKFMGLKPMLQDEKVLEHDWADVIYGDLSMDELSIESMEIGVPTLNFNPKLSKTGYLVADYYEPTWSIKTDSLGFKDLTDSDTAFYSILNKIHEKCNNAHKYSGPLIKSDYWEYVELLCGKLSEGIPVIVSPIKDGNGHALVAYKSEMIDENTVRVYVYDCNRPDDYVYRHLMNSKGELIEDAAWIKLADDNNNINYVDFTKVEVERYIGNYKYEEDYMFKYDSYSTSFGASSEDGGLIKFVFITDDGGITYIDSSESRTKSIISCNAKYTIDDNTATVRLFGTYNSGEIYDITNEDGTHLEMDYSYLGQYKIKENKIILLDKNKHFTEKNTGEYIEFVVVHSTKESRRGETRCRLYIESN